MIPGDPQGENSPTALASNLTDVVRAAPILQQSPSVALAVAKGGGNVHDNAHAVAAVAHTRALDIAAQRMAQQDAAFMSDDTTPEFGGTQADQQKLAYGHTGKPNLHGADPLGDVLNPVIHAVTNLPSELQKGVEGNTNKGDSGPGGFGPGTVQFSQGMQQQVGGDVKAVAQTVNPLALMTTPQHLYRTWADIEAKHGPAAMVEAMIPSIAGAGAAYFLTHSPKATEEAATGAAELVAPTADAVGETNAAQRTGQMARKIVTTAAKPVTVPAGAAMRAAVSVGSSPTFLGANIGGLSTRMSKGFEESWNRTANGSPRGEVGSFGRLIATGVEKVGRAAHLPGMESNSMLFNALSGSLDAFSNIAVLDPLGAAGRVIGQAKSAEGLGGPLGKFWGGTAIQSPDDVDRIIKQYPAAQHFVEDAAKLNAGQILLKYGQKSLAPEMAARLGQASSPEAVVHVLKDSARVMELATTTGKMPTLTGYTKIKSALADTKIGSALTTPLPTMFDEDTKAFTGREFTAGDPNAVESIMHLLRASGESPQVVTDLGTTLLETSDPRRWQQVLSNVSQVAIGRQIQRALGKSPLTDEINRSVNQAAEELFGGRGAGHEGIFGISPEGTDLSTVMTDPGEQTQQARAAALFFNQQGKMVMPTVRDVQKVSKEIAAAVHEMSAPKVLYAKGQNLRDLLDTVVNHKFFQPMALATGGWALRVSSSEMLLNAVRQGPLNFTASAIARSAAKHDLAIGLIHTDPRVLADMDKSDALAEKAIQSSAAKNSLVRGSSNLTRNIVAATRGILAGVDESILQGLGKERFLDAATKLLILHDGYIVPGRISAVHNLPLVGQDEVARKEQDIVSWRQRTGAERSIKNVTMSSDYGKLSPNQSGYFSELSAHQGLISADQRFGRQVAQAYRARLDAGYSDADAAAATIGEGVHILENIPAQERAYMLRNFAASPDATTDALTDWSTQALQAIRGATSSQYGVLHREMLDDIADGTVPQTAKDMLGKYGVGGTHPIPPEQLPRTIPGRIPHMDSSQVLQRAASYMHTRVFGKVVNYLSREPTYIADFANESKTLEKQVAAGVITQDQSDVIAQTRAIFKSLRFVHNPQDRMKIEQTLHVIAPFYFAKNQAIRRAGRLLASNPGAFEQYLKLNLAVQNISFRANQNGGSSQFVFPGSAVVGSAMTGIMGKIGLAPTGSIPISLSGSTDAMQAVVPWAGNGEQQPGSPQSLLNTLSAPTLGPLGAIPVKAVANFASGFAAQEARDILGPIGSNTQWWTYLVPNSGAQHIIEAALFRLGSESAGTSANSALLTSIAAVAEEDGGSKSLTQIQQSDITGKNVDPSTAELDPVAQAKLIKQIVNMTAVNLIGRAVASYFSPVSVTLERADLKMSQEVQTYITAAKGNVLVGTDNFMRAHPDAVASTVYESTSDVGSGWAETAKVGQWMQQHNSFVSDHPDSAQWFVPPTANTGPYSSSTHMLQIAEGLRHVNTPQEFLSNIYVASGNAWYFNAVKPQLDAALKAHPAQSYQIYNTFDQYVTNYGKRNPTWLNYWQSQASTTQRQQSLVHLREALADPAAPKGQQTQRLQALVNGYDKYLGAKAVAQSTTQRDTLKANWQAQMTATAKEWPDVAPAVTDLFSHLS